MSLYQLVGDSVQTNLPTLFKFIVIGDANSGKTALVTRFVDDLFDPHYCPTVGVEYFNKFLVPSIESNTFHYSQTSFERQRSNSSALDVSMQSLMFKVQIWDLSGDERFSTIIQSYHRTTMAVIITYDISNRESYDNAINGWLKALQNHYLGTARASKIDSASIYDGQNASYLDKPTVILVGTKSDLDSDRQSLSSSSTSASISPLSPQKSTKPNINPDSNSNSDSKHNSSDDPSIIDSSVSNSVSDTDDTRKRVVTRSEAEKEARNHHILFVETSAKNGDCVSEVFGSMVKDVYRRRFGNDTILRGIRPAQANEIREFKRAISLEMTAPSGGCTCQRADQCHLL